MRKGLLNNKLGGIMKKRVGLVIATLSLLTFAAVASLVPRLIQPDLEVKSFNNQVETILNKTTDLKKFQMAEVKL
ncbi:MAG: hypothetical protein KC493_12850 [Bacteriovoracaceae bacterium]|nr:hypothetical protein [Bacteriovoracaceae bacterium]